MNRIVMHTTAPEDAIALEGYERLADAYAARIDTKAHNAYYERPATLSLLPAVEGKRVLDAGCGPGVYAEWLVNWGRSRGAGWDTSSTSRSRRVRARLRSPTGTLRRTPGSSRTHWRPAAPERLSRCLMRGVTS